MLGSAFASLKENPVNPENPVILSTLHSPHDRRCGAVADEEIRGTVERGLDIDDVLGQSQAGPINVSDVIYGYGVEIEESGNDFYAHKTGFSQKSLWHALRKAGFAKIFIGSGNLEINSLAFKSSPDAATRAQFGLPQD